MSSSARCDEEPTRRQHEGCLQTRQAGREWLLVHGPALDLSVVVDTDPRHQGDAVLAGPEPAGEAAASFGKSHERDRTKGLVDDII